jgi:hypothetical protein
LLCGFAEALVVRLAASGQFNMPTLGTLLNQLIPFFKILSALEFGQTTAMEIFRNTPKLSFNFVATHYKTFNFLPAE